MNVDTAAIRRLRDGLLARGLDTSQAAVVGTSRDPAHRDAMLGRVEPFAETMYLVMMADGELAPLERQALAGALDALTAGALDTEELQTLQDRFAGFSSRDGSEARLRHIGARLMSDREDRETAFTLAAVLALADQRVDPRESDILALVQEHLGISGKRAAILLGTIG